MKTSLVNLIRTEKSKNNFISLVDYAPAFVTNVFSVIFASSIILELKNTLDNYVLIILSVFVVLFLVMNEVIKVREIRKVFKGYKNSIITFIITFLISFSLATVGIYFFTNKTSEIKDNTEIDRSIHLNEINSKYAVLLAKNEAILFEDSKEFSSINKELVYWKNSSAATLDERNSIRQKVDKLQSDLQIQRKVFYDSKKSLSNQFENLKTQEIKVLESKINKTTNSTKKNDFITYIFLCLIIVTEFSTIILNKVISEKETNVSTFVDSKVAKTYIVVSNILTTLYLTKTVDGETNIDKAKYSRANKDEFLNWEELCYYYNIFINLGILDRGGIKEHGMKRKMLLTNNIIVDNDEAHRRLDNFFEQILKMS